MLPNPVKFTRFGAMDVTKPYQLIEFGAMDVTKPCKFIGFGAMDVTKPYEFIRCGAEEFASVCDPWGSAASQSLTMGGRPLDPPGWGKCSDRGATPPGWPFQRE